MFQHVVQRDSVGGHLRPRVGIERAVVNGSLIGRLGVVGSVCGQLDARYLPGHRVRAQEELAVPVADIQERAGPACTRY